jgi:hypothetical protein
MDKTEKDLLLLKTKEWFGKEIVESHVKRTASLTNLNEFDINPFLVAYLAKFLGGKATPENIAKALVYPRALGTSINTSFGARIQNFTNEVLGSSFASMTAGMDIEFIDAKDNRRKYCQMKLGPNTINNDDVATIAGKFDGAKRIARTNGLKVHDDDFVIGVMFGEKKDVNGAYKKLEADHFYSLYVGQEFWTHLTGDKNFYSLLIEACSEAAKDFKGDDVLQGVINELSKNPELIRISKLAE